MQCEPTEPIRLLASRRETAIALAVSVRTIDALAERGELHPIFIGTRKLFLWDEVRKLAGITQTQVLTSEAEPMMMPA
jgi:hypothetical protein